MKARSLGDWGFGLIDWELVGVFYQHRSKPFKSYYSKNEKADSFSALSRQIYA